MTVKVLEYADLSDGDTCSNCGEEIIPRLFLQKEPKWKESSSGERNRYF